MCCGCANMVPCSTFLACSEGWMYLHLLTAAQRCPGLSCVREGQGHICKARGEKLLEGEDNRARGSGSPGPVDLPQG